MKMKNSIKILVLLFGILQVEAQTSTFDSVEILLNKGRYQEANELLEKIPDSFEKYKEKAEIYERLDQQFLVSSCYEKALQFKNDYAIRVKLGRSYKKEGKYLRASKVYEQLYEEDKDNLFVAYELGKLYLNVKQANKALELFKELIRKDPTNANYSYYKGIAYKLLKKRNNKINSFLEAYRKDENHIKSIENLAYDFVILKDKDSASIFIEKGLALNPNHIELNKLKINDLFREKNYKEAIELLNKIDTLKPNEHYTKKMLGRSYFHLKDFEKARKNFKLAGKIDRSDFKVFTYLGDIDFEEEDYKGASFHYNYATFIGKDPRDEEYYQLARTYEKLQKPKMAMLAYENALRESSGNYRALFQLATLTENYYKDKKLAYRHYKRYLGKFEGKDEDITKHVELRLKEIKKFYFLKGEILE